MENNVKEKRENTRQSEGRLQNLTTLCLNGTVPCVDFMDVTMGDIPYITTLCLNGTVPCVDFMEVIVGDIPIYNHTVFEWDTFMC